MLRGLTARRRRGHTTTADDATSGGLFGLLGLGMIVCCGLPLLLGAGIAVGAAGLVLGSGLLVALGVAAAIWSWRRRTARHPRR